VYWIAGDFAAPHVAGTAIFSVVLAFNLFGDGLRDTLDPRHRG
jgi:ABC-type dipeptide/oligopeptide/nickel transport system permease subunit